MDKKICYDSPKKLRVKRTTYGYFSKDVARKAIEQNRAKTVTVTDERIVYAPFHNFDYWKFIERVIKIIDAISAIIQLNKTLKK